MKAIRLTSADSDKPITFTFSDMGPEWILTEFKTGDKNYTQVTTTHGAYSVKETKEDILMALFGASDSK